MRNYPKLSIEEFGAHLLTTGDLDPIYIALNRCKFDEPVRNRWLVAYCAFYSAGFASFASEFEGSEFWDVMYCAAKNEEPTPFGSRWPRGSERRHFRGKQAVLAVEDWSNAHSSPEYMMSMIEKGAPSFHDVMKAARSYRSVGDWMGFKLVDLVDACMNGKIDQSDVMLFMYDAPRKSLLNRWREKAGLPPEAIPKDEDALIKTAVAYYVDVFKDLEVPHKPGVKVDMFCLETVFCKFQSHLNGHYPLYNDIQEISHGLEAWIPYSENARLFNSVMPTYPKE